MQTGNIAKIMNAITNINCKTGNKCLKCPIYNAIDRSCGLVKMRGDLLYYASFITNLENPDIHNEILIGGAATLKILKKARVTGGYTTSAYQYRYRLCRLPSPLVKQRYFEVLDRIQLDKFEERVKRNEWETVYCGYVREDNK